MKIKIISVIAFFMLSFNVFGQAPEAFKYQAVIYGSNGSPMANQNVQFMIEIKSFSPTGPKRYAEFQKVSTNSSGLVSLEIGTGNSLFGDFSKIDWGADKHYLKVDFDETGGTNFKTLGTSQLLTVPYALYAKNAQNVDDADADASNEIQSITLDGNLLRLSEDANPVDLSKYMDNKDKQRLKLIGTTLKISNANSVDLKSLRNDADADPKNEIQNLELSGNVLTLSGSSSSVNLGAISGGGSPTTQYYSVDPADFKRTKNNNNDNDDDSKIILKSPEGRYLWVKGGNKRTLIAPVHLPQGAIIDKVTLNFRDSDPSAPNIRLQLLESPLNGLDGSNTRASLGSGGASSDGQVIFDTNAVVDNSKFLYRIRITIPGASSNDEYRFYSALIEYIK